ncbi:MAG TPA: hypothetical protein VH740_10775 [Vicinamibacterales bacterium]|jgi:hypothetical protein
MTPTNGGSPSRGLLDGARVYLSGPMDFVASREEEMKNGWRTRVGAFLRARGCIVFDPWQKPEVRGLQEYGREGLDTAKARDDWTFEDTQFGAKARSKLTGQFWETLHIDLRMVDTSDFTIAYCPTNIYSVGTPHEIALCRQQRKPVLFVSPPVEFPALDELRAHLTKRKDDVALAKLTDLENQVPIKPNPRGIPSLWYMPLVGGESFFDGFGFDTYRGEYGWAEGPLDKREKKHKPKRPLLKFLDGLAHTLPQKWDRKLNKYVRNDDWLLWDLRRGDGGAEITRAHGESSAGKKQP